MNIPVGSVMPYAGGPMNANIKKMLIEQGWFYCDGSELSRTEYSELFSVINIFYGEGDRVNTFNLPDFRGYFLRGVNDNSGRDPDAATRTAMNKGGATGDHIGSVQSSAFMNHNHSLSPNIGLWNRSFEGSNDSQKTVCTNYDKDMIHVNPEGGRETRSLNAYIYYIIKYNNA